MKIVAVSGSPRKNGNTAVLIREVFKELEKEGIKTELIQLAEQNIKGCSACYKCFADKNKRCAIKDDVINDCIARLEDADGILIGSPTYFADCSAQTKAFIDRVGMVARANSDMFKRKIGAAVVAVRRAGAIQTFDSINHFFSIGQMITVGSCYWNIGVGREPGEVSKDEEGLKTMAVLGQNMAWLLKKLK